MQEVLDRSRRVVLAHQYGWVVGVDRRDVLVAHFLLDAEETVDRGLVVGSRTPCVARAELELRQVRVTLHGVERREQSGDIDAVTVHGAGHIGAPF